MAQFYGEIQGFAKTHASRRRSKSSGLWSHIRGWNIGVEVNVKHDDKTGYDVISIYKTGGSNDSNRKELITEISEGDKIGI